MKHTQDSQNQKEYTFIRDHLALHRTDLANDKTFLAYIRTALTFFVVGVTFLRFFGLRVIEIIGWVFMPIGAFIFIKGLIRYKKVKRVIREEERNPPKVSDI
jgi:putative membrane protein